MTHYGGTAWDSDTTEDKTNVLNLSDSLSSSERPVWGFGFWFTCRSGQGRLAGGDWEPRGVSSASLDKCFSIMHFFTGKPLQRRADMDRKTTVIIIVSYHRRDRFTAQCFWRPSLIFNLNNFSLIVVMIPLENCRILKDDLVKLNGFSR